MDYKSNFLNFHHQLINKFNTHHYNYYLHTIQDLMMEITE